MRLIQRLKRHRITAYTVVERAPPKAREPRATFGEVALRLTDTATRKGACRDEAAWRTRTTLAHVIQSRKDLPQAERKKHLLIRIMRIGSRPKEQEHNIPQDNLTPLVHVHAAAGWELDNDLASVAVQRLPVCVVAGADCLGDEEREGVDGVWDDQEQENHAHEKEPEEAGAGGVACGDETGELAAVAVEADKKEDWRVVSMRRERQVLDNEPA